MINKFKLWITKWYYVFFRKDKVVSFYFLNPHFKPGDIIETIDGAQMYCLGKGLDKYSYYFRKV